MRYVVSAMLFVVGIIHLLPLSGVLGVDQLASLYGVTVAEPNSALLLRHRAVLVGVLGVFLIAAAFRSSLQRAAFAAGLASVVSFLWLAWPVSILNTQLTRVFYVDVVALVCLCAGSAALALQKRGG